MPPDPNARIVFQEMKAGLETPADPGYLQYWEERGEQAIDERVARIVQGLTRVAIRGLAGRAEFTDREPALQARYWYRSLGPLNPMTDIEPDLITAASMMYGKETKNPEESANLRLDSAYALTDLAHITERPKTALESLRLAYGVVQDIKNDKKFKNQAASYRLQTLMLEGDLLHDAARLRATGSIQPRELKGDEYRAFEKSFVTQELKNIEVFGEQLNAGITEENVGIVFEWCFSVINRHQAWKDETLDTVAVRGATSRENAEWTGEHEINPDRVTTNHDVVISSLQSGGITTERWQLNLPGAFRRRFDSSLRRIGFEQVFGKSFENLDQAVTSIKNKLLEIRAEYRGD